MYVYIYIWFMHTRYQIVAESCSLLWEPTLLYLENIWYIYGHPYILFVSSPGKSSNFNRKYIFKKVPWRNIFGVLLYEVCFFYWMVVYPHHLFMLHWFIWPVSPPATWGEYQELWKALPAREFGGGQWAGHQGHTQNKVVKGPGMGQWTARVVTLIRHSW